MERRSAMRVGALAICAAVWSGCAAHHDPLAAAGPGGDVPTVGDGQPGSTSMPSGAPESPAPAPQLGNGASSGVVSFVQVSSDRVADVSSFDAWRRAFIRDGMSDADKAQAIW